MAFGGQAPTIIVLKEGKTMADLFGDLLDLC